MTNVFVSEVTAAIESVSSELVVEVVYLCYRPHVRVWALDLEENLHCRLIQVGDHTNVAKLVDELRAA